MPVARPIETASLSRRSDMGSGHDRAAAAPLCSVLADLSGRSPQFRAMDEIDHAIIDELLRDGRLSNVELAERINLSPSPCLRRVRALEQAGVIRGYHADVDPAAVGRGFEVTVHIELHQKDRATVEEFESRIARMDAVVECRRMFGVPDYIVRVAVADA